MLSWIHRFDKKLGRPIETLLRGLFFLLFSCYYILLILTLRMELRGGGWEVVLRQNNYHALVSWHGRLLLASIILRFKIGGKITSFNSPHSDGRFIARLNKFLWIDTVYGAPNKDPQGGLKRLVAHAKRGCHILLMPDGSSGPAQVAKRGVVLFAKMSAMPILPLGFSARHGIALKSWDKMLLPLPFSRVIAVCGAPIAVSSTASKQTQEQIRKDLQDEVSRLTREADEAMGRSEK